MHAASLHTEKRPQDTLLIAGHLSDTGLGFHLSSDVTILRTTGEQWLAQFEGPGQTTTDIQGPPAELVSLILDVYQEHCQSDQPPLHEAVSRVMQRLTRRQVVAANIGFGSPGCATLK